MPRADDPLLAVVAPPHAARLRELAGIAVDAELAFDFTGWSKRVVLVDGRALLFPRDHHNLPAFEREVTALRAVAAAGLEQVPVVLDVWDDPSLSPYPVVAVTRRPGRSLESLLTTLTLDQLAGVLDGVARLAARWHMVPADAVSPFGRPAGADRAMLETMLAPGTARYAPPAAVADRVTSELGVGQRATGRIADALELARSLDAVVLHGDLHEAQIMVGDHLEVTGVIDWQTAHVGHPYLEFDFGEWGTAIWRERRADLPELRGRQWAAYAAERRLDTGHALAFDWVWAAHHALFTRRAAEAGTLRAEIAGTPGEALEMFARATEAL